MSGKPITRSSSSTRSVYAGHRRFEHWYVDNQVYFITSKCRDGYPAFASDNAKAIFWERFEHHTHQAGFVPWVTSLLDNHYHTLGYLKEGEKLGPMMRRVHGSVAKLVNDLLEVRRQPFWRTAGKRDYFDGCIRDEKQCRLAYRYALRQAVRHGVNDDWRAYPHTRISVELEKGVARAKELRAFMEGVPYLRYRKDER